MASDNFKYVSVVIHLTFLFTSLLLITVGGITHAIYGDFSSFIDKYLMLIPILLMIVGTLMLIYATFGLITAFKENAMSTYINYLLSLVFVLEILTAIGVFILHSQVREVLIRTMNQSFSAYTSCETVADDVDFMQRSFECCGVDGPNDWEGILPTFPDSENITILVPNSCCTEFEESRCIAYFLSGCLDQMHSIIGQNIMVIAIGVTTAAGVQILIVLSACLLRKCSHH